MARFDIDCPQCGAVLPVPEELRGKKVRCKTCQAVIVAEQRPPLDLQAEVAAAVGEPAAEMEADVEHSVEEPKRPGPIDWSSNQPSKSDRRKSFEGRTDTIDSLTWVLSLIGAPAALLISVEHPEIGIPLLIAIFFQAKLIFWGVNAAGLLIDLHEEQFP